MRNSTWQAWWAWRPVKLDGRWFWWTLLERHWISHDFPSPLFLGSGFWVYRALPPNIGLSVVELPELPPITGKMPKNLFSYLPCPRCDAADEGEAYDAQIAGNCAHTRHPRPCARIQHSIGLRRAGYANWIDRDLLALLDRPNGANTAQNHGARQSRVSLMILKATVVTGDVFDHLSLTVDLPRPDNLAKQLNLQCFLSAGAGAVYCRHHFAVEPTVIIRRED